jgi:hypothetical protein
MLYVTFLRHITRVGSTQQLIFINVITYITHSKLRHAFIQCCASFPLLRWEYLYAMAAAIKNMDSAVTRPRYQTKKSEGSRVPDYLFPNTVLSISRRFFWCLPYLVYLLSMLYVTFLRHITRVGSTQQLIFINVITYITHSKLIFQSKCFLMADLTTIKIR